MTIAVINLPVDRSGKNVDNLIVGEEQPITPNPGKNYRLITLTHGGFYENELIVYDENYVRLKPNIDYILTYYHKDISEYVGLDIYSLIVVLNQSLENKLYITAQMVGGDIAYSFTVKDDYTRHLITLPYDYTPVLKDYYGNEPIYHPGELEKLRWKLDTYQPFNNEIAELTRTVTGMYGEEEEILREYIREGYRQFINGFEDIIKPHVEHKENPHVLTKSQIGLSQVENLSLASEIEAKAGDRHDRYLTPALTWKQYEIYGEQPIDEHIAKTDNPHQVSPEQLKTIIKSEVDAKVVKKYFANEVVEDSRNGYFNGKKNYSQILSEFRDSIPATAFTTGLVNPRNMTLGTPSTQSVITSHPFRWSDWNDLLAVHVPEVPATVAVATFSSGTTQAGAHNFIKTQRPYRDLPVNSIVFYKIYAMSSYGRGNGNTWYKYAWFSHMSYRNQAGSWIAI